MLIGITGTDGAGKGAAVRYLVDKKGFTHFSSRDLIIEQIVQQKLPVTRENTRLVGNQMRKKFGNDVLIRLSLKKAREQNVKNIVIESIRALAELETLHAQGGYLLAIDANQNTRYRRITGRKSETDHITFAEFVAQEKLEMNDPDPNGMQKAQVMQRADYTVQNDSSMAALAEQLKNFLRIKEQAGK